MAFVFRDRQKQNKFCQTPGPGSYLNNVHNKQITKTTTPFNNRSNREVWKINNFPGPGFYQTSNDINNENKIFADDVGEIAVYQTPNQTVSFKSQTVRFSNNKKMLMPGPGDYQLFQTQKSLQLLKKSNNPNNRLKQFLKNKNKQLQKGNKQQLLKEMIIATNEQGISQKPKSVSTYKRQLKPSNCFVSKVDRNLKQRPQTSIGPGSYNVGTSNFDIQKKDTKKEPTQSIRLNTKQLKHSYQEVGPGSYDIEMAYNNMNKSNNWKNKKLQCFGSTVDRFLDKIKLQQFKQGLSCYMIPSNVNIQKSNHRGSSFGKQKRKVFQARINYSTSPSSYKIQNNFSKQIRGKCSRGKNQKGSFGSTQQRFKSKNQFQLLTQCTKLQIQNTQTSKIFKNKGPFKKSGVKRKSCAFVNLDVQKNNSKQIDQKPIIYDNQSHTLSFKYGKKLQVQAPFMSCAQRFQQKNQQKTINLEQKCQDEFFCQRNCKSSTNIKLNKKIVGGAINFSQSRFKCFELKQNELIGPQYYNPYAVPSKKSYNILFS